LSLRQKKAVMDWLPQKQKFTLLYKATQHGFKPADFHKRCDVSGTLTVIQSEEGYLFGGYTSESWTGNNVRKRDPNSFLFTLTNPHSLPPSQYPVNAGSFAILCNPSSCAIFGGYDMVVLPDAHLTSENSTFNFPRAFFGANGKGSATFVGGEGKFRVTEVEVYLVV